MATQVGLRLVPLVEALDGAVMEEVAVALLTLVVVVVLVVLVQIFLVAVVVLVTLQFVVKIHIWRVVEAEMYLMLFLILYWHH
jgi:hypothetical protein